MAPAPPGQPTQTWSSSTGDQDPLTLLLTGVGASPSVGTIPAQGGSASTDASYRPTFLSLLKLCGKLKESGVGLGKEMTLTVRRPKMT